MDTVELDFTLNFRKKRFDFECSHEVIDAKEGDSMQALESALERYDQD